MKKSYLLFFSLFFASAMLLAQKTSFNKKITNKMAISPRLIAAAENNGVFIMGRYIDFVSPAKFIPLAIKVDKNGNIQWSKQLLGAMGSGGFMNGIVLRNGNYLTAYGGNQSKRYLTMFDNTFAPIWTLQLNSASASVTLDYFTELSDGNIAATGNYYNAVNGFQVAILNPTSGAVVWLKRYESLDPNANTHSRAIKETNDGQLLVSSTTSKLISGSLVRNKLLKIKRLDGDIIWQKEFTSDLDYIERVQKILEDKNGNLYLHFNSFKVLPPPSYNKNKNGIVKLDKDANIKWLRTYGDSMVFMSSLLQKKDGSLLAVIDNTQNARTHYLNLNQDGDIVSQSSELSPSPYNYQESSCFTNDGSLMTAENFDDCISATTIYLRKRANDGKGNCSESSDLNLTNDKIVFSNYLKDIQVKAGTLPSKVANFKVEDFPITIVDETTFCQDTTYIKRCSGDVYAIGKNKYTKDGIYKDTITQGKCDSIVLSKLTFSKKGITTIDTAICAGKSFVFNQKNYNKAGLYQDSLKNSLGCDSLVSLNLKVQDININVSDDVDVSAAEKTTLVATTNVADVQWLWSPPTYLSCTDCPNPTVTPLSSLNYTVKVKSKFGCSAEGNINVNVKFCNQVFVPNAFSPNGDGVNDQLVVFASECATKVKNYSIFDRWGALVYERSDFPLNDSTYGWDGKFRNQAASTGVYVYKVSVEFTDGKTRNFSGDVFLE